MITIYHKSCDDRMHRFEEERGPCCTFERVAHIDSDDLEAAFVDSQHLHDWPWFEGERVTKIPGHDKIRSSSVGDVFVLLAGYERVHVVTTLGFKRLGPDECTKPFSDEPCYCVDCLG